MLKKQRSFTILVLTLVTLTTNSAFAIDKIIDISPQKVDLPEETLKEVNGYLDKPYPFIIIKVSVPFEKIPNDTNAEIEAFKTKECIFLKMPGYIKKTCYEQVDMNSKVHVYPHYFKELKRENLVATKENSDLTVKEILNEDYPVILIFAIEKNLDNTSKSDCVALKTPLVKDSEPKDCFIGASLKANAQVQILAYSYIEVEENSPLKGDNDVEQ